MNVNYQLRKGSKELIVFLHGLGCDHTSFLGAWGRNL